MVPTLILDEGPLCTHLYFQAAQQNFTLEENYTFQNSIDFASHNIISFHFKVHNKRF